ncbi:molybdopterin-dependent oxidoreductase [Pseudaquabacterium pictum]|uniref:Oxidoreductase n=1 Tax=Pseudaquabacterium pictum TaxID=2315236 RepID=A0A480AXP6_9BURK|nr:molybdopterin-dependent oxidoreductase [Rubrivivax pictus]GCL65012.1 oxidoreductase [Rubrivivax pictus]
MSQLPPASAPLLPARQGLPSPTRRRTLRLGLAAATLLATGGARALAAPKGKVVLSVVGTLSQANAGARADFDMAMLEALPQHSFTTSTPWFKEPKRFSGPLLRDVLAAAGAKGTALRAVALNDYKVEIPVEDALRHKVLLATRLDGQPMPVREKGPLFIIYPYDESADLRSERYYSRSAWQLRTLEVR